MAGGTNRVEVYNAIENGTLGVGVRVNGPANGARSPFHSLDRRTSWEEGVENFLLAQDYGDISLQHFLPMERE